MLLIDTHQAVLVNHQDSLAVADVEQGRCHGVMRGTVGITPELLELTDAPSL